jgi:hypothetical protein
MGFPVFDLCLFGCGKLIKKKRKTLVGVEDRSGKILTIAENGAA